MEVKNIDSLLVSEMQNTVVPQPMVASPAPAIEPAPLPVVGAIEKEKPANDPALPDDLPDAAEVKEKPIEAVEDKADKKDSPIDEYGNPIEKQKMYSEEEVNRLIRERLARGRQQEQIPQPQYQSPPVQQEPTQPAEEDWEAQLKTVIKKTLYETQEEIAQRNWQQQEAARQLEFQSKFQMGMDKHKDFHEVVSGKPITDSMMLATRNLNDPAAFIYSAAKFHAQDLTRISQISDPYAQASEIGRLHEKMVKTKNVVSSAPRPLEVVASDMPAKNINNGISIEQRINEYAKQKRK